MNLVYQNDPSLPLLFQKEGCRARILVAMPEFYLNKALTAGQIDLIIHAGMVNKKVLSKKMETGPDEYKLTLFAFKELDGTSRFFRQIGFRTGSGSNVIYVDWKYNPIDPGLVAFTILHWQTEFPDGHWTLGDSNAKEIFDPWKVETGWNPWDPSRTTKYTINKKLIDRIYVYRMGMELV